MTDFISLDDYMATLPADRQQTINDRAETLSQSIELAKLSKAKQLKQSELTDSS